MKGVVAKAFVGKLLKGWRPNRAAKGTASATANVIGQYQKKVLARRSALQLPLENQGLSPFPFARSYL